MEEITELQKTIERLGGLEISQETFLEEAEMSKVTLELLETNREELSPDTYEYIKQFFERDLVSNQKNLYEMFE